MYRFYCEEEKKAGGQFVLTGTDVNHIKNVLRMKPGETMIVCDGKGKDYYCRIETLETEQVVVDIEEERPSISELPVSVTLCQGLPKKDKMELIIQKAVELGATHIVPVAMKRCVVKLEDEKKEVRKRERWQAISESAAKQSGRGVIPEVTKAVSYQEAIKSACARGMVLVPYEHAEGMSAFQTALAGLTVSLGQAKETGRKPEISVFIGPEGGFEEEEIELAIQSGAIPVSLGKRILRTETAGLTVLSILMYEIECAGEKGKQEWKHI
ncbi:MAG: 16S rRNA (uracil(1498)-N(3))-methyltransferase [Lachnospiraceae bacterium]